MRVLRGHWLVSAVALLVLSPTAAMAHSNSVDSDPADDSSLPALPHAATVTFNEPVSNAAMALTDPRGHVTKLRSKIDGAVVSARLPGDGAKGAYVLAYRVVSADGHPVTGEVEFTVTTGSGPAAVKPTPSTPQASAPPRFPIWAAIGGGAVLLLAAVALVRSARR